MKHPNPEKCFELADIFKKLHEENENRRVDMQEVEFNVCETLACHAGWFAVYKGKNRRNDNGVVQFDYDKAADEMAQFMFDDTRVLRGKLEEWAEQNEFIWGNNHGNSMFHSELAFGTDDNNLSLLDISNHWRAVGERIKKHNEKQE